MGSIWNKRFRYYVVTLHRALNWQFCIIKILLKLDEKENVKDLANETFFVA